MLAVDGAETAAGSSIGALTGEARVRASPGTPATNDRFAASGCVIEISLLSPTPGRENMHTTTTMMRTTRRRTTTRTTDASPRWRTQGT